MTSVLEVLGFAALGVAVGLFVEWMWNHRDG